MEKHKRTPDGPTKPDVEMTPGGIKMRVKVDSAEIIFDPANITFVVLPRTWSEEEFSDLIKRPFTDKTKRLVDSEIPFIPGVKPYRAWLHIFNPLELKTGSGTLAYSEENNVWEETDIGKLRFTDPNALSKAILSRLEQDDMSSEEEISRQNLHLMRDEEIEERLFNVVLKLLPRIVRSGEFSDHSETRKEVVGLTLRLAETIDKPDDTSNYKAGQLYDEYKEVFSRTLPENKLFRYGRPLLVSDFEIDKDATETGTLNLV